MKCKSQVLIVAAVAICVVALAGCQPKSADSSHSAESASAAEDTTPIQVAWTPDSDCSSCHSVEDLSMSDTSCAASQHSVETCMTCHDDEEALAGAHEGSEGKKPPVKLKKTEVADDVCLSCHGSYEELAEKTADLTLLTDENGKVVNPHEVKELTESHEPTVCGDCHKLHSPDASSVVAPEFCLSCHHENVYECGTCHD